ncbi:MULTISPECIES: FtsX-like permease family protein [unclassified Streptomyces]|uniref:ABC transporter permease n=1 Tax=unclassified Streptomyces TaxID=2593676 RepID=UPI00278C25A3|nr:MULTISPECIES: FtsX-like permease family protein [unclassified Streptomyces]
MIRLALRLTVAGGREALVRLTVIAAAVAVGVALLLSTLAAVEATRGQNDRNAWLNTGGQFTQSRHARAADADPLWWLLRADHYDGRLIGRVDVAATGPESPVPPGLPRLPGPGEFYVSPALAALLRATPAQELADRYPGHRAGTIGRSALPGPDSLIVVVGRSPGDLAGKAGATRVTTIETRSPSRCNGPNCDVAAGIDADGMALILSVVAVALIFPVLILTGTASRLAAARREQRFAAMRLVGATPGQVSLIATIESAVAAVAGTAMGFGLWYALRPLVARADLTGTPFFTEDMSLGVGEVLLVAFGVPVAAAVAARVALRRVRVSPLGVTRRATPRPPRAWRLIPLALGLGQLWWVVGRVPEDTGGQILVFVPAMLVVLIGLVFAGPWLTMAGARLLVRFTRRPALLVAGRRLADDPKAGFRAVSGLVLALCVTSTAVGIITAVVAESGVPEDKAVFGSSVVADYGRQFRHKPAPPPPAPPTATRARLDSVPGVRGVLVIHTNPLRIPDPVEPRPPKGQPPILAGLVSCAELARMPAHNNCRAGAEAAAIPPDFSHFGMREDRAWPAVWPAADIGERRLRTLPVEGIIVTTDGSTAAVERVRTILAAAYPDELPPYTVAEDSAQRWADIEGYQQLATVVVAMSFPIAGCGLAVSVAGGLGERKRPFALLRLTGVPLRTLRRVVLLESAAPLLIVAALAIGTGFLTAQLFLQAQYGYSIRLPGAGYYGMTLAGIVVSLAVIASTLPLLRRITEPETARND